ncbi:STAGA complex 65 subunit gamma-like [Saccoglossus kowalevskii]
MSVRWGDLPGPSEATHSMTGMDVELPFVHPQPIEIEGPRLHQPSQQHKPSVTQIPAELCRPDPISIHTIQLLKHNRRLRSMISVAQQHQQDSNTVFWVMFVQILNHIQFLYIQDVLQQVFHEVGISQFKDLQVFWETRIRNYHKVTQQRAHQLRQEYDKFRNPKHRGSEDNIVKVKEEPLSEISFPLGDPDNPESTEHLLDIQGIGMELEESSCSSNVNETESPHWALAYIKTEGQDRVSALESLSESISVEQQEYPGPPPPLPAGQNEERRDIATPTPPQ